MHQQRRVYRACQACSMLPVSWHPCRHTQFCCCDVCAPLPSRMVSGWDPATKNRVAEEMSDVLCYLTVRSGIGHHVSVDYLQLSCLLICVVSGFTSSLLFVISSVCPFRPWFVFHCARTDAGGCVWNRSRPGCASKSVQETEQRCCIPYVPCFYVSTSWWCSST